MKTLTIATILLTSLTNALAQSSSGTSAVSPVYVPQQQPAAASSGFVAAPPVLATEPATRSVAIAGNLLQQTKELEDQAREMVLVVPGPDLKPEALAAIIEDLTVMCRIFDKTLYPGKRPTSASVYMHRGDLPLLGNLFMQQSGQVQGLYLDGYGAVFFMQVGFPLVAPPEQKQEPKPGDSSDRVWSQTMNELRGQEKPEDAEKTAPAYDAQKVDNLKTTLIKTLRHAANLRIQAQDQITIVVGGPSAIVVSQEQHFGYLYSTGKRRPATTLKPGARPDSPVPDPAATLVLRVSKADVDALAAGKLTAEQFAPKVQTLWSGVQPQATPPTPAAR